MRFNIQFENSNDILPFVSVHDGLTERYIDRLNKNNSNSFNFNNKVSFKDLNDKLYDSVMQYNNVLNHINISGFEINDRRDLLNPWWLNYMHSEWIRIKSISINVDSIGPELRKYVPDGVDELPLIVVLTHLNLTPSFNRINNMIHNTERETSKLNIVQIGSDGKPIQQNDIICKNIFGNSVITNNHCSLYLQYRLEGRSRRNKFMYHDRDYEFTDENNYNFFTPDMVMDLFPQETINYSKEYIGWCNKHNIEPTGDRVNLGNLVDLEDNIFKYKCIVYDNQIAMNNFTLIAI